MVTLYIPIDSFTAVPDEFPLNVAGIGSLAWIFTVKSEDLLLPSSLPFTVVIFTIKVPLFVSEVNGVFSLPKLLAIADELTIVDITDIKNKVQINFIKDLYTTILKRLGQLMIFQFHIH